MSAMAVRCFNMVMIESECRGAFKVAELTAENHRITNIPTLMCSVISFKIM